MELRRLKIFKHEICLFYTYAIASRVDLNRFGMFSEGFGFICVTMFP